MRRNVVRYAVLAYVITLQRVSLRVRKRFPTWQHVVDSGKIFKCVFRTVKTITWFAEKLKTAKYKLRSVGKSRRY